MNKLIAIILLTIFLCAYTSIGQLLKVPNLIEHYKEHQNEVSNNSISFVQFIKAHYSKNSEHNKDEHEDLPFKTVEHTTNVLFTFLFVNFKFIEKPVFIELKPAFFYKDSFKSNLFTSIWLPPKIS
jgi:hypothetical protein